MSNANLISMERYIICLCTTGRWEAVAPIDWSGLQNGLTESLGSYATKDEAAAALKSFFDSTAKMRHGGVMARVEADDQTIKALRLRIASLEKERNELKDVLKDKDKNFSTLRSSYLVSASAMGDEAWRVAQQVLSDIESNGELSDAKMREQTPPPSGGGGGGGGDGAMGWEDDYDDQEDFPSARGYMPSLNGYDT